MTVTQPRSTTATLIYVDPPADGSRAYTNININAESGVRDKNWVLVEKQVEIENLRGKEDSVTLDTAGFQYFHRAAKHEAFIDDAEVEREYYPESIELIKELTGASRVVIFDHTIRRRNPGQIEDVPGKRQPAAQVHADQTPSSAVARVHRHLPASDAPSLLEHRFQIINLWRPISHSALDWPLGLCDYRSVDLEKDVFPLTLKYPDRDGEIFGIRYSPLHQWKYFRGLNPDEGILIKCFDSEEDPGVAKFTPHTAFEDPTTPKDGPLRESVEIRALVFYN